MTPSQAAAALSLRQHVRCQLHEGQWGQQQRLAAADCHHAVQVMHPGCQGDDGL